jgi:hypothetical protein
VSGVVWTLAVIAAGLFFFGAFGWLGFVLSIVIVFAWFVSDDGGGR